MKKEYIKSPINYIGNKYKLIDQIIPLFPDKISMFVDVFGGSGTVLINTKAEHYLYNDINGYVAEILSGIYNTDFDSIIAQIEAIIKKYNLPDKTGFLQLREDYNNGMNDWLTLYVLSCYSFNWQIRFNNNHKYNSSWGRDRSSFTDRQRNGLRQCKDFFDKHRDIVFNIGSFTDLDYSDFDSNDLLYFDPPYFNSVGSYNDGKRGFEGWTEQHERQLLTLLDKLNEQGTRWALSNNLKYDNPMLKEWVKKYHIHYLDGSYSNCSYHKIDRKGDVEVLITNYKN